IFGKPGRKAVAAALPQLIQKYSPDFIFGNAENIAGGRGVNQKSFNEMMNLGFHALTTGNHVWDNREIFSILEADRRLLRPANLADAGALPLPGAGAGAFPNNVKSVILWNSIGRVFMDASEDPLAAIDWIVENNTGDIPVVGDMHAEATGEKGAMGWYLAGHVA